MIILFLVVILFPNLSVYPQQPDWYTRVKQLNILSSTKYDVIHVFGLEKANADDPDYFQRSQWYFDLKDGGQIEAHFYDRGPCSGYRANRHGIMFWNVPDDTLISTDFSTGKLNITLDQLPFSTAGYEENEYYNDQHEQISPDEGIKVLTDRDKRVLTVYFGPSSSMDYMLCPCDPTVPH
jgi:hypothetical protein